MQQIAQLVLEDLTVLLWCITVLQCYKFLSSLCFTFFYLYDIEHSFYAVAPTCLFVIPVSVTMVSILSYRV